MKQRLALLLRHDINLFAYHLPLDAHPELGNNAQFGLKLGLAGDARASASRTWVSSAQRDGRRRFRQRPSELARHVEGSAGPQRRLRRAATQRPIRRIAWCTGGAQGYFEAAIAAGADAFITGEISEPQAHYARECGVAFLACGHHASERYGAPAVAAPCGGAARRRAPVSSRSTTRHEQTAGTRRPIAITMGDAAGIGPEIIAKAFRDAPAETQGCFVAGDLATMRRAARAIRRPHERGPAGGGDRIAGARPARCRRVACGVLQATALAGAAAWGAGQRGGGQGGGRMRGLGRARRPARATLPRSSRRRCTRRRWRRPA